MANTIALRGRIKSVKNTRQITKAMELVSASKMRRAQEAALRSRAYRNLARSILVRLRELTKVDQHPLYQVRPVRSKTYVVITSNRGLAGAYNSNVLRLLAKRLVTDRDKGVQAKLILIGKKGVNFVARFEGVEIMAVYNDFPDVPSANDLRPILNTVLNQYREAIVDAVDIVYTDYRSSLTQVAKRERLLPVADESADVKPDTERAIFEPSPEAVLNTITERLVEVQLWQALLESGASEQAARMMAMKTASDNAGELIDDLTLAMNTARQAAITQELAEITGGADAIQ